jgi:lysophospholipase L1-like esterase
MKRAILKSMKRTYKIVAALTLAIFIVSAFSMHAHSTKSQPVAVKKQVYIALGDSVAAGYGLTADPNDITDCGRGNSAYPNVVARKLNLKLQWRACSGATTSEGILGAQPLDDTQLKPQVSNLPATPPKLISITIGANDIHWTDIIGRCYSDVCGTAADTTAVEQFRSTLDLNLRTVLDAIQTRYDRYEPRVVVTGYYQVFPATDVPGCTELTNVTTDERSWWRDQENELNQSIQLAVQDYSFVRFVPVNFDGHELCATDSWIQDATSAGAFHPTGDGQAAIAKAVLGAAN